MSDAFLKVYNLLIFLLYSKSIRAAIADKLPDQNLSSLVPVLDRFVVCSCWNSCFTHGDENVKLA